MIAIILLSLFIYSVYATQNIIIILGSHDNNILNERVYSTIEYITKSNNPSILYLSGGIKHDHLESTTEAYKMNQILSSNVDIQIVQDEHAQNTAENFAYLRQWVYSNFDVMPNIVISTSDFHKKRAELIFNGIFPEVEPIWNLSNSKCKLCWRDEYIHIKNVKNDISKAQSVISVKNEVTIKDL